MTQAKMICPEAAARYAADGLPAVEPIAIRHLAQEIQQDLVITLRADCIAVGQGAAIGHQRDHGRGLAPVDGLLEPLQETQPRPLHIIGVRAMQQRQQGVAQSAALITGRQIDQVAFIAPADGAGISLAAERALGLAGLVNGGCGHGKRAEEPCQQDETSA